MMLAARGAFLAARRNRKPTARSYVQDGLVAMWDGIENAGWGTHNAAATTWKDLVGTNDLKLYGNCAFADNKLVLSRSNADAAYVAADNDTTVSSANGMTIEYVFKPIGFHNYSALVQFLPYGLSREGWIYSDSRCVPLRWGSARADFLVSNDENVYASAVIDSTDFKMKYYKNGLEAANNIEADNKSKTCRISFFGANGYHFWGDAYCMRLYNRALTADEIAANYAVDKARFNLPDAT